MVALTAEHDSSKVFPKPPVGSPAGGASLSRRLIVLTAAALLVACSPDRTLEAVWVLQDIQAGYGPSVLKRATPNPTRASILFAVDGRQRQADLYSPGNARAGMVLVPGLTPDGRDDRRLVAFANTLARARFEVIVPDLPGMRSLQVTALDAEPIADAVRYLDERGGGRPLGIAAVSFAVGPAVIALDEPAAEGRVDLFLSIGGYYDLTALITYVTTGFYRQQEGEPWRYRQPKPYAKWVFVLTNADRLADPADRATLSEMARRKLADADADVADLAIALGPEGESVYALVTNGDPDRVAALIDDLPPGVHEEIRRLDLRRRDLSRLDIDFLLIHDEDDRTIPAAQSLAFAAAVAPGRAQLYLVEGLDHAQVKTFGVTDVLTLLQAIYEYLRLRDEGSKPTMGSPVQ
jgi:pimeloyl-ACP methyl ester carboxylesterase